MDINDVKNPKEQLSEQLIHLRKAKQLLETENNRLLERLGAQQEIADTIKDTVQALEPLKPVSFDSPEIEHSSSDISAVLMLGDWHIGDRIVAGEIEGINEYNYAIAESRVNFIIEKFLNWVKTHRMAFRIPDLHVFCLQDFISGDIHPELRVGNEFPAPVQTVKAGMLLGQAISTLAPHFEHVVVEEVGGDNHSRLTPKGQFKQKAQNSFGFIVYAILNQLLSAHKNVIANQGDGMMQIADVNGWKFLLTHGDLVKSWMGVPYYGLERQRGKEASRRMALRRKVDLAFDFIVCGHYHTESIIGSNILMNPSLNGTSEYDHGCGRFGEPGQASFLVHPKHPRFNWTVWNPTR